jgi:hypothetical protein
MLSLFALSAALQPEPIPCDVSPETADCGDVPYFGERQHELVVTASLVPVPKAEAPASVTIFVSARRATSSASPQEPRSPCPAARAP